MNNYKNTLNLPFTNFPMKGNLVINEPIILENWYKNNLYNKIKIKKQKQKIFFLHDGPPYANGNIHIGHCVNKIIKDIVIKSKNLMNYNSPYIPGWDCHGLPIELKVEKLIGKSGKKITNKLFRYICRNYANKQILKQKKDFIRLGILGDWDNFYSTMNFKTEANIIRLLSKIISNNFLYRDYKPVYWCLNCSSSLSEAEIEYKNNISPSIFFSFKSVNINNINKIFNIKKKKIKIFIIVWTTTFWTLLSNRAIVLNPNVNYNLIKINNKYYILATNLITKIMSFLSILKWKNISIIKGKYLEFLEFKHPFLNYKVPIILSEYVNLDIGTGIVHVSPCYGIDDYIVSKKYNLKFNDLVKSNGYFFKNILHGLHIFKVNKFILRLLIKSKTLLYINKFFHNYPYCWRHKTPVIFRSTPQWFIKIDKLRNRLLSIINNVNWIPNWGKNHIKNMVINRVDWCISRQRIWGVPITLFVHKIKNKIHPNSIKLIEIIAKNIELKGIQFWWDLNPIDFIGKDFKNYYKVTDILDVWFDSGSTFFSILNKDLNLNLNNNKSDIYIEGYDQYRGWFMSSLIISSIIFNYAPYNNILTHSFVIDNNKKKMSKSLGNIIKPKYIINKFGADILRLWVASSDYTTEISISKKIINHSVEIYRRIRNTSRFLLSNLNNFNPVKDIVIKKNILLIDFFLINETFFFQKKIISLYNNYKFYKIVQVIMNFCCLKLGSFYLNIIKDRQYTLKKNSIAFRSCQTSMYYIIESLVRWISPIISFTASEIWKFIPGNRSKFIFTEIFYNNLFKITKIYYLNLWKILLKIRNKFNKIFEKIRIKKNIKNSLEINIELYIKKNNIKKFLKIKNELHFLFLTSKIKIFDFYDNLKLKSYFNNFKINLYKSKSKKCLRCWHYEFNVTSNFLYNKICKRCITNILYLGEIRKFF